jgi:hypothetical protein
MTNSDLVSICIGLTLNALTFFLGVAVGVCMVKNRKDSDHDRNSYEDKARSWHKTFPN